MPPTVSIIVPCYNTARWVGETVDSVKAQSFVDYELICVDDGSTDNTLAALQEVAQNVPGRCLPLPRNVGVSAARGFGFDASCGKYVLFLDSDDLLTPDALRDHVAALEAGGDVSYAHAEYFRGEITQFETKPLPTDKPLIHVINNTNGGWWRPTGGVLMRRAVAKLGEWRSDLKLCEEVHFYASLWHAGASFVQTNSLGVRYRCRDGSTSRIESRLMAMVHQIKLLDIWIARVGELPELRAARLTALLTLKAASELEHRLYEHGVLLSPRAI